MNAQTRILIVDDDPDDFLITGEYIKHIPGNSYQIDWCPKYNEALEHIIAGHYNLYLVDYRLGAKTGVDLLKEALDHNCEDPIILLTGKGNYQVDLEAMQIGAVDYLVKTELSIEKLERSIRYAIDRAATLKALKENERKYRSIFEKSKDMVFIADEALNFIDVNNAILPLLGYSKSETNNSSLLDFIEREQDKKYLKNNLSASKEVNDWEVLLNTKTGEKKSCVLTVSAEDPNATTITYQGIIHDITSLKKIEKANIQAEKQAATGRLVRTLAHEVRNPLNNILLSVEQVLHDIKDEDSLLYLNMIHRNTKRINDLISELLNSSRPTEITLEQTFLSALLDDVISSAKDSLTLKHIGLEVSYDEKAGIILADKEKLKIAIFNIVVNAIEAMEEGKGLLKIDLRKQKDELVLTIADNGCGISKENVSRLFEPYFTRKRNGMGLGLAFTLNILQSHKANIEVSSAENLGTTFTITFPILNSSNP